MRLYFIILLLFPFLLIGQVFDDFSDGDFNQNPVWAGDANDFTVNSLYQLQSNALETGISHLATPFQMNGETEWRFWIRLNFAPSDNNLARVYLASDQQNIEGTVNGYFLRFGENLSNDAIELYRQNGETTTLICRGSNGLIAGAFQFWVRVRQDQAGNWTIETDNAGFGAYQTDATGFDNQINTSAFMGVYCKYTTSNAKNFFFDQLYAGPVVMDTNPPQLMKLEAQSASVLDLYFNEALLPAPVANIQNYIVSNNIEYPVTAVLDIQNPGKIRLTFDRPFPNGMSLTITIQNMTDLAGNVSPPIEAGFMWFLSSAFDVQINEIMADPDPPVELPNQEYLELLNQTGKLIDLEGWKLIIGTTERIFETVLLQPEGFLIIGHENAEPSLAEFGPFYGFSGFQLTNAGQTIILKNPFNQVISTITYKDDWYGDANKETGGWSLEQIDPANPCGGGNNWTASKSQSGGTPGAVNSVNADNPDLIPPFASRIEVISATEITLHFSEPMDSTLLSNAFAYQINPTIGQPVSATPIQPEYRAVLLTLNTSTPIQQNIIYTLAVSSDFSDCAGNIIDRNRIVQFGLPQPVLENNIVINEVLFNPREDFVTGVDFVEIYNRSDKILDMSTLVLATEDMLTGEITSVKNISEEGLLFFPGAWLVLTTDPDIVMQQYFAENPEAFVKMASLPQYSNSDGVVILATKGLGLIDRMAYSENMHVPLLTSFKGVSLERINYERPSTDITNWHSAAEDAGYATPGYKNSQFSEAIYIDDPITVDPEIFSPDLDGRDDVLNINYRFDQPGYVATVTIYDSRGRLVRKLVNNELLGSEGTFSWDGITDDNQKAPIGIYVIFFEVFNTAGSVNKYKKTAVLGGRLN
ncbi:MAG: lamin tail domain-containing protein [Bacteroidales bacterium]|nr:lamin tail domain-containing protein [Bacteroidales bacterium]